MIDRFLCGKCCFKYKLNKSDRINMANRMTEGSNTCEDCGLVVIFEDGRWIKASTFVVKQGKRIKNKEMI
jgi:hypothetical protein